MTRVEMEFELGVCNGTMHIDILEQDQSLASYTGPDTEWKTNFNINWPTTITVKLSNKNMKKDTQIDAEGNIVADKYVKLSHMSVNGFALNEQARYAICNYSTESQTTNETYWSFPGEVHINFDQANPMRWNLALNNVLFFRET